MDKAIDYYFTPVSPWTYLGHARFVDIARKRGAAINVKPVNVGKVFSVSGGLPLKQRAPQRQAYRLVELARWKEHLHMPLNPQPRHFPVPAELASHWILAAAERSQDDALRLAGAQMRAVWAEERDISDAATLAAIAQAEGLDAAALQARAASAEVQSRFEAMTQEAIERQVFGAPSYVYRGELFWGQDRLDFLDRRLADEAAKYVAK
jgi:2-hydroxychromene-2-carboxylate isomerase